MSTLRVNEIYLSVQGESTWAGLPCVFVRLTACDLRCSYCDTAYAFTEGIRREVSAVRNEIERLAAPCQREDGVMAGGRRGRLPLVEFTGGEPLLQAASAGLMADLCDAGWTVLVETSGAHDITRLHPAIHRIVDVKCPGSGEVERNRWANLEDLRPTDEVKFVIGTWEDYAFARRILTEHDLAGRCSVLFSWVAPLADAQRVPSLKRVPEGHRPLDRRELVDAILADGLPVRFQLQMHKVIWSPEARGV